MGCATEGHTAGNGVQIFAQWKGEERGSREGSKKLLCLLSTIFCINEIGVACLMWLGEMGRAIAFTLSGGFRSQCRMYER